MFWLLSTTRGLSVTELGQKFGIYSRTATAHLVRRSIPLQQRGMTVENIPEAVSLYGKGLALAELGLRLDVSQQVVRQAIAAETVEIRRRGRHPRPEL